LNGHLFGLKSSFSEVQILIFAGEFPPKKTGGNWTFRGDLYKKIATLPDAERQAKSCALTLKIVGNPWKILCGFTNLLNYFQGFQFSIVTSRASGI